MSIMSLKKLRIPVYGMTCGNCARMVERKLTSSPGVVGVQVDLAGSGATVEFDPARTSAAELGAAIEKLGFQVARP
jgi:copper chaperone CopZ